MYCSPIPLIKVPYSDGPRSIFAPADMEEQGTGLNSVIATGRIPSDLEGELVA